VRRSLVRQALQDIDVVYHQAAEVGVGQSMYQIRRYVQANDMGTAVLLEAMIEHRDRIRKLVVRLPCRFTVRALTVPVARRDFSSSAPCHTVEPALGSRMSRVRRHFEADSHQRK
jgi:UDP-glucose 4-epimerase